MANSSNALTACCLATRILLLLYIRSASAESTRMMPRMYHGIGAPGL